MDPMPGSIRRLHSALHDSRSKIAALHRVALESCVRRARQRHMAARGRSPRPGALRQARIGYGAGPRRARGLRVLPRGA
jgi:hypothetical protein